MWWRTSSGMAVQIDRLRRDFPELRPGDDRGECLGELPRMDRVLCGWRAPGSARSASPIAAVVAWSVVGDPLESDDALLGTRTVEVIDDHLGRVRRISYQGFVLGGLAEFGEALRGSVLEEILGNVCRTRRFSGNGDRAGRWAREDGSEQSIGITGQGEVTAQSPPPWRCPRSRLDRSPGDPGRPEIVGRRGDTDLRRRPGQVRPSAHRASNPTNRNPARPSPKPGSNSAKVWSMSLPRPCCQTAWDALSLGAIVELQTIMLEKGHRFRPHLFRTRELTSGRSLDHF